MTMHVMIIIMIMNMETPHDCLVYCWECSYEFIHRSGMCLLDFTCLSSAEDDTTNGSYSVKLSSNSAIQV